MQDISTGIVNSLCECTDCCVLLCISAESEGDFLLDIIAQKKNKEYYLIIVEKERKNPKKMLLCRVVNCTDLKKVSIKVGDWSRRRGVDL